MKADNQNTFKIKNPLALLKPKTLLKATVGLLAAQQVAARDVFVHGPTPALAPAPTTAPAIALAQPAFDPTSLCAGGRGKADQCRLELAEEICNNALGEDSFDEVKQAISEPYDGSARPALQPQATYGATCGAVKSKLQQIQEYCLPSDLSGPC